MADTPIRDQKTEATRARIAETALELFAQQGYGETSIDQIAEAAGVGRRTVFRHFTTKEAILFDHLVVRREHALQHLRERPDDETPVVSLHAVLRQLAEEGYDRRLLAQIRAVLATEPHVIGQDIARTVQSFERDIIAELSRRNDGQTPMVVIRAVTLMALSWLDAAARTYLLDNRPSMVVCFDEVVAGCLAATADLSTVTLASAGGGRRATRGGDAPGTRR